MIGIDTNILVAFVIPEHPVHDKVRERLEQFQQESRRLALTSGILAEFVHVVTDPRRFANPLTMAEALTWATFWSEAEEFVIIPTDIAAHRQWLVWLEQHHLGRKRLLDTQIAATWWSVGIREILTLNQADFKIFDTFLFHALP
jgi:predicted nucleic acid-binding protein